MIQKLGKLLVAALVILLILIGYFYFTGDIIEGRIYQVEIGL